MNSENNVKEKLYLKFYADCNRHLQVEYCSADKGNHLIINQIYNTLSVGWNCLYLDQGRMVQFVISTT